MSQTTDSVVGLSGGYYIVWILDANSCSDSLHIILNGVLNTQTSNSNKEIQIYPNPAQDKLFINSDGKITNIKIYNLQGELVFESIQYKAFLKE